MGIGEVREIRIHGVSGTPARSILRTEPVSRDLGGGYEPADRIEILARPTVDPQVLGKPLETMAYRWGRLTAGSLLQAFWILLLPYTLINAAGWMLPKLNQSWSRTLTALVRLAGLAVTATFVLLAANVSMDLMAFKCHQAEAQCVSWLGWPDLFRIRLVIGALVPVAVVGLIYWVIARDPKTTRTLDAMEGVDADPAPVAPDDPAQMLTLTDPELWARHAIEKHLGLLHMAVGVAAVAAVLALAKGVFAQSTTPESVFSPWGFIGLAVAPLLVGGTGIASVFKNHKWRFGVLVRISLGVAVAGFVAVALSVVFDGSLDDAAGAFVATQGRAQLPGLQQVTIVVAGALGVIGVLLYVFSVRSGNASDAIGPAAMLVLAGLISSAFGSGVILITESALVTGETDGTGFPGMDWIAVGFLVVLLAILAMASFMVMWFASRESDTLHGRLFTGLSEAARRVRTVLLVVSLVGLLGGMWFLFVVLRAGWNEPIASLTGRQEYTGARILAASLAVLSAIFIFWFVRQFVRGLARDVFARPWMWFVVPVAAVIGVAVLVSLIARGFAVLGVSLEFNGLSEIATSLAVLLPTGLIIGRMVTGIRKPDSQRAVGVLWDLGSFWPRWYHPFSAPYYTPVAVPDLQSLVATSLRSGTADPDQGARCLVLAAHSQGSIIAMAALLSLQTSASAVTPEEMRRLALLTYGSPITKLYATMFPAHFNADTVAALRGELTDATADTPVVRWRNLFRVTDPIGGAVEPVGVADPVDRGPLSDPDRGGHSGYEGEPIYRQTLEELVEIVVAGSP